MILQVVYTRSYAALPFRDGMPPNHPASPIVIQDYPAPRLSTEIHFGALPPVTLEALKQHRAFLSRVLRGGFSGANQVRAAAAKIADGEVWCGDTDTPKRRVPQWFVTIRILDEIELAKNASNLVTGVADEFALLDQTDFFDRHSVDLDRIAADVLLDIAQHRYRWLVCDQPFVTLPTGLTISPLRFRGGQVRAFVSPPPEALPFGRASSSRERGPVGGIVHHFLLRSVLGTNQIDRFFDAFRSLEQLCKQISPKLKNRAVAELDKIDASAPELNRYQQANCRRGIAWKFAILALAYSPSTAEADLREFRALHKATRDDWAHGDRQIGQDEIRDDAMIDLLLRYLAFVRSDTT